MPKESRTYRFSSKTVYLIEQLRAAMSADLDLSATDVLEMLVSATARERGIAYPPSPADKPTKKKPTAK